MVSKRSRRAWRATPCALSMAARSLLWGGTLAIVAAAPVHAAEPAVEGRARDYAIAAGALADVLAQFAAVSGVQLVFDPALLAGQRSPGLRGRVSMREGFDRLLQGSGFGWAPQGDGIYALRALPAAPATSGGAGSGALPTVTVTGQAEAPASLALRKAVATGALGARSQLETPFSSAVVSGQQLEERQASNLGTVFASDASAVTAGGSYTARPNYLLVRGLRLDDSLGAKVNGLPVVNYGIEMPYEHFEQVELLKGLSGFMYGFGTPGGILNYVTRKPPAEGTVRSVDLGYRSDSVWSQHVDLGGRDASQRFGYRLNATHEEGSTYNHGALNRNSVSLGLDARLTPDLLWSFDAIYQERRSTGQAYVSTNGYTGAFLPAAIDGRRNLSSSAESLADSSFRFVTTGLQYAIDRDWKLSANYSYTQTDKVYKEDYLYLTNGFGNYSNGVFDWSNSFGFHQLQVMLEGAARTGPIEHQLVFGAQRIAQYTDTDSTGSFPRIGTGNLFLPNTNLYTVARTPRRYRAIDITQKAAFASDTLKFSDAWSLLAGLRYTDYEQLGYNSTGKLTSTYGKHGVLTPTVALTYKPAAGTAIYASYVESLEAGSIVGGTYRNANEMLDPIKSKQYEIGVKTEHDAWSATAALFRIERAAAYVTADNRYVQDGLVRYQGLEFNAAVSPARGWTLGGSLMLLDADYRRTNSSKDGNRVAGAPRQVVALQASYDLPQVPGLTLGVDGKWVGRTHLKSSGSLAVPAYFVLNAGASYLTRMSGHPLTLRLRIDNLAGRKYWYAQGEDGLLVGAPRTVSLNARFDF